jgi:hypothetical protein
MGNAAVNDLGILGRRTELLALAQDHDLHVWVRHQAALELARLGATDSALPLMASVLREPVSNRIAENLLDEMGECNGVELLREIVYDQDLSMAIRLHAIEVLGTRRTMQILQVFCEDSLLPDRFVRPPFWRSQTRETAVLRGSRSSSS